MVFFLHGGVRAHLSRPLGISCTSTAPPKQSTHGHEALDATPSPSSEAPPASRPRGRPYQPALTGRFYFYKLRLTNRKKRTIVTPGISSTRRGAGKPLSLPPRATETTLFEHGALARAACAAARPSWLSAVPPEQSASWRRTGKPEPPWQTRAPHLPFLASPAGIFYTKT